MYLIGGAPNARTQQLHSYLQFQLKITNTFRICDGLAVNNPFLVKVFGLLMGHSQTQEFGESLHKQFPCALQCLKLLFAWAALPESAAKHWLYGAYKIWP